MAALNHEVYFMNLIIGIDQSYKRTGITILVDKKIRKIKSIDFSKTESNSEKRRILHNSLNNLLYKAKSKAKNKHDSIIVVIERIRLQSQGFINIDYIKSIGALNSVIVDVCHLYDIPVYSVDTRCWKASVIGTSKGAKNNYSVPEEKWPTVRWVISKGHEQDILREVQGRKAKGTFMRNGTKYEYDNDAADSVGIAYSWYYVDKDKLKPEH